MKKTKPLTDKELFDIRGGYYPVITGPILLSQKVANWVVGKISK
ncbi:hypothetical protein AB3331_06665 [Streptococcus sp. H49]